MKRYALSDIHGCYEALMDAMKKIDLSSGNEVVFLGDYIDRGKDSYKVLQYIYDLQKQYPNQVIVLKGNHERYLEGYLFGNDEWLIFMDYDLNTTKTFIPEKEFEEMEQIFLHADRDTIQNMIRNSLLTHHKELFEWMKELPYYYETNKQIFVHAGIDEEAGSMWKELTEKNWFLEKMPATFGKFEKDIIAGHIMTSYLANDPEFNGVYYDGESHYYIDGHTSVTGVVPVLEYDVEKEVYIYD